MLIKIFTFFILFVIIYKLIKNFTNYSKKKLEKSELVSCKKCHVYMEQNDMLKHICY